MRVGIRVGIEMHVRVGIRRVCEDGYARAGIKYMCGWDRGGYVWAGMFGLVLGAGYVWAGIGTGYFWAGIEARVRVGGYRGQHMHGQVSARVCVGGYQGGWICQGAYRSTAMWRFLTRWTPSLLPRCWRGPATWRGVICPWLYPKPAVAHPLSVPAPARRALGFCFFFRVSCACAAAT